ncbi:MAG: hypothetical protein ACE5LC_00645 [Candidatus Aminicenantales bacterium]
MPDGRKKHILFIFNNLANIIGLFTNHKNCLKSRQKIGITAAQLDFWEKITSSACTEIGHKDNLSGGKF